MHVRSGDWHPAQSCHPVPGRSCPWFREWRPAARISITEPGRAAPMRWASTALLSARASISGVGLGSTAAVGPVVAEIMVGYGETLVSSCGISTSEACRGAGAASPPGRCRDNMSPSSVSQRSDHSNRVRLALPPARDSSEWTSAGEGMSLPQVCRASATPDTPPRKAPDHRQTVPRPQVRRRS